MASVSTENIREAVNRVKKDPMTDEYTIRYGTKRGFHQQAVSIAEELGLDNDEYQISESGIVELVQEILLKVGETAHSCSEDINLNDEFENQKQMVFSDTFSGQPNNYEIVFPLDMQVLGIMPSEIDINDSRLELLDYEEWQEDYLQPARKNESSNFKAFYDENPNEPGRIKWSYWRIMYPARDALYAIYEVKDILQLMMAEVNFINYRETTSMPRPVGSNKPPRDRWSYLQLPFVFLAFHDGDFERYYPLDYNYRGGLADRIFMPQIESFDSLPGFYKRRESLDSLEELITNSLIAFQDGITEPVFRRSFFDFWRGVENLAGEDGLKYEDLVDRAVFALDFIDDYDDGLLPETEEAISELATTRNEYAHEWPDIRISERHRDASKILLDGLIILFLEHRDEYEIDDFRYLLEFGVLKQTDDEIERMVETLIRLGILDK